MKAGDEVERKKGERGIAEEGDVFRRKRGTKEMKGRKRKGKGRKRERVK